MTRNISLLDPSLTRQFFVGFDPLLEEFEKKINGGQDKYPPHDIVKVGENQYQIVLAIAGFTKENIDISIEKRVLTIRGSKPNESGVEYLYKGISQRQFKREFVLQTDVIVGSAKFENGLLTINLERVVPEAELRRTISLD